MTWGPSMEDPEAVGHTVKTHVIYSNDNGHKASSKTQRPPGSLHAPAPEVPPSSRQC